MANPGNLSNSMDGALYQAKIKLVPWPRTYKQLKPISDRFLGSRLLQWKYLLKSAPLVFVSK
jgi:hypothetical protein